MKDVAKLAGVSLSTVSRVLNKSSLVKEETARRVRKAVSKLDYQVNDSARILRTNTSNLIGVIGAGMEHPFLASLLKGLETEAREQGYSILLGDSDGEYEQEKIYLNIMKQKKIDGIVIISANVYTDILRMVKESGIPIVFASGYINDRDVACVTVDNVAAAYDVVDHFFQKGHEKLGIIRGPNSDLVASEERIRGVRLAYSVHNKIYSNKIQIEGDFTFEGGYVGTQKLLEATPDITAIFSFNDEMAVGAIRAIEAMGKKVPDDIEVIGFDDIPLAEYVKPSISTVSQSGYELGAQSIQLLHNIINKNHIEDNKIFIPHKLVYRESTI